MNKYIIGFDIGGTKCAVLLANVGDGVELIDKIMFMTETKKGYQYTVDKLFENGWNILKNNNIKIKDVLAIGISCGGPLDSKNGIALSPPNLPGWDNIPLARLAGDKFGIPAFLQNDANACALVEWKLGAGRGTRNMVFLTMGTGFGAGIICENALLQGANDMAGEVGHIRLEDDGPVGFGKAGSVEGFCSGGGIGRQALAYTNRLISEGQTPAWIKDGIALGDVDAKIIANYAEKGDPHARHIYSIVGEKLGEACSILIDILNPEMIVIGSIFARSENLLRESMEKAIKKEALSHSQMMCRVVPAATGEKLGDLASIMAACYELGIEASSTHFKLDKEVQAYYDKLFDRFPELQGIKEDILEAFYGIVHCYKNGGKLLVCGNGGSAADSDHIVGELMKGFYKKRPLDKKLTKILGELSGKLQGSLPAIALTQHNALSTAFSNDVDPCMVFAQQVLGYGVRGDIFIGISTSGNAGNVVNAAKAAKALGLKTVALTGEKGGELANICDITIKAPAGITAEVQEYHLPIYHTLCAMVEEEMF